MAAVRQGGWLAPLWPGFTNWRIDRVMPRHASTASGSAISPIAVRNQVHGIEEAIITAAVHSAEGLRLPSLS